MMPSAVWCLVVCAPEIFLYAASLGITLTVSMCDIYVCVDVCFIVLLKGKPSTYLRTRQGTHDEDNDARTHTHTHTETHTGTRLLSPRRLLAARNRSESGCSQARFRRRHCAAPVRRRAVQYTAGALAAHSPPS